MPFNIANQYTPNHKVWDHAGNAFPNVEHSEGERPAGEFKPAPWLPVQFFDKYYENWYVVLPGKILACDNDGDLVPAQYEDSSVVISYTQNDVDQATIDVETGLAVTVVKTVAVSGVTTFLGASGVSLAVSKPLGVAPYGYLQWAGGTGDSNSTQPFALKQHNYNMQHLVAMLCDYVLILPLVPGKVVAEAVSFGAPVANVANNSVDLLASLPVAKNTVRTAITFADGGSGDALLFTNEVPLAADVKASGDWSVNLITGLITVFATSTPSGVTVTYCSYALAPVNVSVFAAAVGNLTCGDFVAADSNSNFQIAGDATDFSTVMGQVLEVIDYPRGSLEKVRTAWQPAIGTDPAGGLPGYTGQLDQMPGFATGGVPDYIHYAGAANLAVTVNLISR